MKASVGNCITHKSGTVNLPMANAELDKWLKFLRKTVDPTVFKVWVVQDGRVTHIVPYAAFCEVAGV